MSAYEISPSSGTAGKKSKCARTESVGLLFEKKEIKVHEQLYVEFSSIALALWPGARWIWPHLSKHSEPLAISRILSPQANSLGHQRRNSVEVSSALLSYLQ
ncbi:MAG: hypothetical protein Q9195_003571 [Heterodermia aff. obscurata]